MMLAARWDGEMVVSRRVPVAAIIVAAIFQVLASAEPASACVAASPGQISLDEGITVAVLAEVTDETEHRYRLRIVDALVGGVQDGQGLELRHGSPGCSPLFLSVGERVALLSVNPDGGLDYFGVAIWHVDSAQRLKRAEVAAFLPDEVDPGTVGELTRLLGLPDTTTADGGPPHTDMQARFLFIVLVSLGILFASITMGRGSRA